MKIAFCLSGHLRTYERCLESFNQFKSYVNNFGDIDIFISTWEEESNPRDSLHQNISDSVKSIDILKIKEQYNPILIGIHSYRQIENYLKNNFFKPKYNFDSFGPTYSKLNIPHHMRGYYLLYQVSMLKESIELINNFKYDLIFRIRPDFKFNQDIYSKIDFSKFEKNIFYAFMYRYNDVDDQFGFGDSRCFSKYCKTFFHLDKIGKTWENAYDVPRTSSYGHPEMITYFNSIIEEFDFLPIPRFGEIIR